MESRRSRMESNWEDNLKKQQNGCCDNACKMTSKPNSIELKIAY